MATMQMWRQTTVRVLRFANTREGPILFCLYLPLPFFLPTNDLALSMGREKKRQATTSIWSTPLETIANEPKDTRIVCPT